MTTRYPKNSCCEICGRIGRIANADGWVTCVDHTRTERPPAPLFAWDTGEVYDPAVVCRPWEEFIQEERHPVPLAETYAASPTSPSITSSSATNPGSYANRFCEVCGVRCGGVYRGWSVCNAHVGVELPDSPAFDAQSGARLQGES